MDQTTSNQDLGYFASVLLEIDFAKPITEKVCEEGIESGFWKKIDIPWPLRFCNHCKIIGHMVNDCRVV